VQGGSGVNKPVQENAPSSRASNQTVEMRGWTRGASNQKNFSITRLMSMKTSGCSCH
jgi:hypothetical protein